MRITAVLLVVAACKGHEAKPIDDAGRPPFETPKPFALPNAMPTTSSLPVPADWPPGVPIYAGAHISKVDARPSRRGVTHVVEFETTDDVDRVIAFYSGAFPSSKKATELSLPSSRILEFDSTDQKIEVMIASAMGVTSVSLTVGPP